jgi:hypothetical protein
MSASLDRRLKTNILEFSGTPRRRLRARDGVLFTAGLFCGALLFRLFFTL